MSPLLLALHLLAACGEPAPLPLPPSAVPAPVTEGRRVRKGAVDAFLARPLAPAPPAGRGGLLLRVADLGPEAQARAEALALARDAVVLAVPPAVPEEAARSYLAGLPGVREVLGTCDGAACP